MEPNFVTAFSAWALKGPPPPHCQAFSSHQHWSYPLMIISSSKGITLAWMSGWDKAITGNIWWDFGRSEVAEFREETDNMELGRDSQKNKGTQRGLSDLLINFFNISQLLQPSLLQKSRGQTVKLGRTNREKFIISETIFSLWSI